MTTFGVNIIDEFPWRERYYNDDLATGSNDGTSEANAWQSITDMIAGVVPGDRVNCKKTGSAVAIAAVTTFPSGTLAGPVCYRGYTSEIGDGVNWVGQAGTGNYFVADAGGMTIFQDMTFNGVSVSSSFYTMSCDASGQNIFVRCTFSSDGQAEAVRGGEAVFIGCNIDNSGTFATSGYEALVQASSGAAYGCKISSDGICIDNTKADEGDQCILIGNLVRSDSAEARDCIEFGGTQGESANTIIVENSCFGGLRGINIQDHPSSAEFGTLIAYNVCSGCDEGFGVDDTANLEWATGLFRNAVGANTTADYDTDIADYLDMTTDDDINLSGSPFDDTTNLTLDSTAGEGAACRSAGIIGFIGGTGAEKVSSAFTLGGWREGTDDGGDSDNLVGFTTGGAGGGGLSGRDFGKLPINKTGDIV